MDISCQSCAQMLSTLCPRCDHDVPIWIKRCLFCGGPVEHRVGPLPEPNTEQARQEMIRLKSEKQVLERRLKEASFPKALAFMKVLLFSVIELVIFLLIVAIIAFFAHDSIWWAKAVVLLRKSPILVGILGLALALAAVTTVFKCIGRHWRKYLRQSERAGELGPDHIQRRIEDVQQRMEKMKNVNDGT